MNDTRWSGWPGFRDFGIPGHGGCSVSMPVALPQNNISNQANQGELLSLSKHSMWLARQNFLKGSDGDGRMGSGWVSHRENCRATRKEPCGPCTGRNIALITAKALVNEEYA